MKCAPPFSLQGFPAFVAHIYPYRWAQNLLILWRWIFFSVPFCLIELFTHIPTDFLITFLTHVVKKKYGHPLLGLSSKVFTFDHLFPYRSDFSNTLATYLAEWPEYRKNKCLSSSTNRVGLHFRKRVEKTKSCTFEGNIKNIYILKFLQILVLNCFQWLFG